MNSLYWSWAWSKMVDNVYTLGLYYPATHPYSYWRRNGRFWRIDLPVYRWRVKHRRDPVWGYSRRAKCTRHARYVLMVEDVRMDYEDGMADIHQQYSRRISDLNMWYYGELDRLREEYHERW